jgi:hypothetical protein
MTVDMPSRRGAPATDRNHWFPYKYISADDLTAEQEYLISRHRAHNRLLHGCGVLCGLRVTRHGRPECAPRWLVVGAGIALDAFGRELILEHETAVELPTAADAGGHFVIGLRYREQRIDEVPILYADPGSGLPYSNANRIREGVEIVAEPESEFDPARRDVGPGCIEPAAADEDLIVLAVATVDGAGGPPAVEDRARRIGRPTHHPTRIVEVSWAHGGSTSLAELKRDRRLVVRFDQPLATAHGRARGIGEDTFLVAFARAQEAPRPVPSARAPRLSQDGHEAEFEIAEHAFHEGDEAHLANATITITLRCDFIVDRHGVAVSGRHLGGRLPSGDGSPGGTFASWFHLQDEDGAAPPRQRAARSAMPDNHKETS